ncbi:hypothetical protein QBC38DRAFT_9519 [Podospora fimiseda]|uniref:Uncharacterized protein n=1 Tax=Podospora fimiseda TaxID=252190 RepID=A0AAN7H794_9PEZI|nr:hypothetical protein QBC38DRAFT_9519 [Podospora fimiseda]
MPEDFTVIREAPPLHAGTPTGTRSFPPHPQAHANHSSPRIVVANPQFAGHHYHTRQSPTQPFSSPFLNQHAQPNIPVKISDIRRERPLTSDEAREILSEYCAYRFERFDEDNGYSSGSDRRKKPSWLTVMRTEVPEVLKHEIARTVRNLNKTSESASEKKRLLNPYQQRHIEKTLEELQNFDDDWYHIELVQIDDPVLRSKDRARERDRDHDKDRGRSRGTSRHAGRVETIYVVRRRQSSQRRHSRLREPKMVASDHASFTAYFKKSPRHDVDPLALLSKRDTESRAQFQPHPQPQYVHHTAIHPENAQYSRPIPPPPPPPPSNIQSVTAQVGVGPRATSPGFTGGRPHDQPRAHLPLQNQGQRRSQSPRPVPVPVSGPLIGQAQGKWPAPPPPPLQVKPPVGGAPLPGIMKKPKFREPSPRRSPQSPRDSTDESAHSDPFSYDDDDDDSSSQTSVESVHVPHHQQQRFASGSGQNFKERQPSIRDRRPSLHQHYPPPPPPVPQAPPVQVNLQQPQPDVHKILSSAYRAGRADEREEAREDAIIMAERIAAAAVSSSPPKSALPHQRVRSPLRRATLSPMHPPRSGVRHLVPVEILDRRRGSLDLQFDRRERRSSLDLSELERARLARRERQQLRFDDELVSLDESYYRGERTPSPSDVTSDSRDNHRRGSSGSSSERYYYISSSPTREERVVGGERRRYNDRDRYEETGREKEERLLRDRERDRYAGKANRARRDSGVDITFREEFLGASRPARRYQGYVGVRT